MRSPCDSTSDVSYIVSLVSRHVIYVVGVPRPMHQVSLPVACMSRPPRVKEIYLRSRDQKRDIRSFMKGCGVRRASVAAVFSRCEDMLRDAEGRSVRIRRMSILGKVARSGASAVGAR